MPTPMATGRAGRRITRWRPAGRRTGCSMSTSGPSSTPWTMISSSTRWRRHHHRAALGAAVCHAVADRAAAAPQRDPAAARPGHPTRVSGRPGAGQPGAALGVRRVPGAGVPDRAVRTVCRRRRDPLCDRAAGPPGVGRARCAVDRSGAAAAPGQDPDRVLQGQPAARFL